MLAADYPFLDVLWTMCIFFLFFIWIWLLITVFADVFRRRDIGGGMKAICGHLCHRSCPTSESSSTSSRSTKAWPTATMRRRRLKQQAGLTLHQVGRRRVACDGRRSRGRKGLLDSRRDHAGRVRHHQAKCAGFRVANRRTEAPPRKAPLRPRDRLPQRTSLTGDMQTKPALGRMTL